MPAAALARNYRCPAKINLFLKLLNKRDDGYHNLQSLIAPIDLFDEISIVPNRNFSVKFCGEFADFVDQKNNLFTDIFAFFVSEFRLSSGLKLVVTKNIPVGAGLGGGSSNAAGFIKIINQIFKLELNKSELQAIGLRFGSDIPFFFEDRASLVSGRGELIFPFYSFNPIKILLINPKIILSTASVFSRVGNHFSEEISSTELANLSIDKLLNDMPNDLTEAAILILPIIGQILHDVENHGALTAKMSGSGATCFGIFNCELKLRKCETFFRKRFPDFFVAVHKILPTLS